MSRRLDHIIRSVLSEQLKPRYTTQTELLNTDGINYIKTHLCTALSIPPSKVDTDRDKISGFYVTIKRRGQIPNLQNTGDLLSDPKELQNTAIGYLDIGLGGTWAAKRATGYYWFITPDQKVVKQGKKSKAERTFSTYRVLCAFVSSQLIKPDVVAKISDKTTGYIHTFKQGGLVFDMFKLVSSEWAPKLKKGKVGIDLAGAGAPGVPQNAMKFKDTDPSAKKLALYFGFNEIFNVDATVNLEYYGCAHREIMKVFQEHEGLPVTGNYSIEDKQQLDAIVAKQSKLLDINVPTYNWSWLTQEQKQKIQDSIKTCQIENKEVALSADEIIVPEGGFKAGEVDRGNINFYAVQKLMLAVCEKVGENATGTAQYRNLKKVLETESERGYYWKSTLSKLGVTQQMVKMIKQALQYTDQDPNTVDQNFVNFLKANK